MNSRTLFSSGGILSGKGVHSILEDLRSIGWISEKHEHSDFSVCFVALVKLLGIKVAMYNLCEILPFRKGSMDLTELLNSLANLGFIGTPLKTQIKDIDRRLLPCLFIPQNVDRSSLSGASVIVCNGVDQDSKCVIFDGGQEKMVKSSCFGREYGTAYFFVSESEVTLPTNDEVRKTTGMSWFRAVLERFKGVFFQMMVLSATLSLVSLATPLFVMMVYDRVIGSHSLETLEPLAVGILLALLAEWILRGLRSRVIAWFSARLDSLLSNQIFEKLMLMASAYTERSSVAAQISRIRAFDSIRDFFSGALFITIVDLPFSLLILIPIFLVAGDLVYVPLTAIFSYFILFFVFRSYTRNALKLTARAMTNRQQLSTETFEKMHSLRAGGGTRSWFRIFRDLSGKASLLNFDLSRRNALIESITHFIFTGCGIAVLFFGIQLVWQGELTTGALIATVIMTWRVLTPAYTVMTSIPKFDQLLNAINQVNRLIKISDEGEQFGNKAKLTELEGNIEFNKVGLRYLKEADPVFVNLSFRVKKGEIIAITGSNGSGKSTILKLILGLYSSQVGAIRIDNRDVRQLDSIELRKLIAYVPQQPSFFSGSILENLRFSDPLATDEDINMVLLKAGILDEINALPQGLNTQIGEHADFHPPIGLMHRLSLARAYMKKTQLVLIDELPYALLTSTAGNVLKAILNEWRKHRTVFIVSHREDYLEMADKAILLRANKPPVFDRPKVVIKRLEEMENEGRS